MKVLSRIFRKKDSGRLKSKCLRDIQRNGQVIHIHILLVAPLGTCNVA